MKKIMVKDLTAEEKINLVWGKDFWHTNDLNGKLPYIRVTDASMGVRMPEDANSGVDKIRKSVAYPSIQVLANTWDLTIVKKYAECVASDCLDAGADIILGPGVNIKRSPLCGRNYEYFSEDPFFAGVMAKEYVCAVQNSGIGACVKHFCANNLEYDRQQQSSELDERTLREVYYQPFRTACEAKPLSVMCSYNRINGVRGSENKKGFDILRNEYGFDGAVISDWGAVYDSANAVKAGCDLSMPYWDGCRDGLVEAYKSGELSESELDDCAQRVLDLIYSCIQLKADKKAVYSLDERIAFTREVTENGIVLLKNNGILPLNTKLKISMCGLYARPEATNFKQPGLVMGEGSGKVERITPMFDILTLLQKECDNTIEYETAFADEVLDGMKPYEAITNAARSDVNLVFAGTGTRIESEGHDRLTMKLPDAQVRTIIDTAKVNKNTVVVLFAGAAIDMREWIDKVAAVVYVGFPGECGGEAVVNVLTGKVNPSGKLTETFPLCYEDTPAAKGYADSVITRYDEGLDVGYKYYEANDKDVLFPFGYGLSYSEFVYSNPSVKKTGSLCVDILYDIRNVSKTDGKEVSQVYIHQCGSKVYRPYKELKGFSKNLIKAGDTVKVCVSLDKSAFEYWSNASDRWQIDDGIFEILIGSSSADIKLTTTVQIKNGKIVG